MSVTLASSNIRKYSKWSGEPASSWWTGEKLAGLSSEEVDRLSLEQLSELTIELWLYSFGQLSFAESAWLRSERFNALSLVYNFPEGNCFRKRSGLESGNGRTFLAMLNFLGVKSWSSCLRGLFMNWNKFCCLLRRLLAQFRIRLMWGSKIRFNGKLYNYIRRMISKIRLWTLLNFHTAS